MEFTLLHDDVECNCIEGAGEDNQSAFLRTIDGNEPKEKDFFSHWERYKKQGKPLPHDNCGEACALKGLSINKGDGYSEDEILEVYKNRLLYLSEKERRKRSVYKFKLGGEVGVVKHTPDEYHDSHHDLYKCDAFTIDKLQVVEIAKIKFD